jgi:hypothetical protein
MVKVVFSFDDKSAKKLKNKKNILGGKGANLGEMGRLGFSSITKNPTKVSILSTIEIE